MNNEIKSQLPLTANQSSSKIQENKALQPGLIEQNILYIEATEGTVLETSESVSRNRFFQLKGQENYLELMVISLGNEIPQVLPYT